MINWLLGLNTLHDRIQHEYFNELKIFLIKEDFNYLEILFSDSKCLSDDLIQINQLYFWSKLFIWYQTRTFTYQLHRLTDELKKTRVLFKRCLLIECEIDALTSNWSAELIGLKSSRLKMYRTLGEFFREIRKNCNLINERHNESSEKLCNDNQISKLPIEIFDTLLDANEFNYVKLKSLVQLIKLEISELLTLIIFYYSIDRSDFYLKLQRLSSAIYHLTIKSNKFNQLLNEDCSFFNHFFMKTQQNNNLNSNLINTKQNEILLNLRLTKTKICSSLLMIDSCLTKVLNENSSQIDRADSEKIIDELASAIGVLRIIPTETKVKTQFVRKEVQKLNSDQTCDSTTKEIKLNEEIPDFEVFETYIEEDDRQIDKFIEKYEDHLFEGKPKLPDSLYGELKEVLNVKTKVHRTREAKALGIDEEELEKQRNESIAVGKWPRANVEIFINPFQQSPFTMKMVGNSAKKMNFISNGEILGDELSSESDE